MKKLVFLFISISILPLYCIGQENKEDVSGKKLDTKILEILQKKGKFEKVINDTLFIFTETEFNYIYQAKPIANKFRKVLYYYKNTLTIESEYLYFINMNISIKRYDRNGILTKKINYDKGFENFTLNDFIETVKEKLKIDLNKDHEGLTISRYVTKIPEYHVYIYDKTSQMRRTITINGNNGSIISDESESIMAGDL